MRCDNRSPDLRLPVMAAPVLCTPHLARLARFYQAAGFRLEQQVPGVLAVLSCGVLHLQLWARADAAPGSRSCITFEPGDGSIFDLYASLARSARALLEPAAPRLEAWGAWEFALTDIDGHRLVFAQWASDVAPPAAAARQAGRHRP